MITCIDPSSSKEQGKPYHSLAFEICSSLSWPLVQYAVP